MKLYIVKTYNQYDCPSDNKRYCGTGNFSSTTTLSVIPFPKGDYQALSEVDVPAELVPEIAKYLEVKEWVGTGEILPVEQLKTLEEKTGWFLNELDCQGRVSAHSKTIEKNVEVLDRSLLQKSIHYSYTPKNILEFCMNNL